MKKSIFLIMIITLGLPAAALASIDLVQCSSDGTCHVKIYRSDQPELLGSYQLYMQGVPQNNIVTISYDGHQKTITCDGTWQNLWTESGLAELQNKIKCTRNYPADTITADLELHEQKTYNNGYTEDPGQTWYPFLTGKGPQNPHCEQGSSIISNACVWQSKSGNKWYIFAKTEITGLQLGDSVPDGQEAEPLPANACWKDYNNNGSFEQNEVGVCAETPQGPLCLIDAVLCTDTTSEPICPEGTTLNTETDICEAQANISCSEPGYVYNPVTGKCEKPPTCPAGGSYNPNTKRCEAALAYKCPVTGQTYSNSNTCQSQCLQAGVCTSTPQKRLCRGFPDSKYKTNCVQWTEGGYSYCNRMEWQASDYQAPGDINTLPVCPEDVVTISNEKYCRVADDNCWVLGYIPYYERYAGYGLRIYEETLPPKYTCSYGGIYDNYQACVDQCTVTQACNVQCPQGYQQNGTLCITNPTCIDFNAPDNVCQTTAIYDCPSLSQYNGTTGVCSAYPICQAGQYRPETNDCYEGNNTCPYGEQWPCMDYEGQKFCSQNVCTNIDNNVTEIGDPVGANDIAADGQVDENGNCLGQIYIYNGRDQRCRSWGLFMAFGDCCKDDDYLFGMNRCEESEIQLAILKGKGLCHYIGEYCSREIDLGFTEICIEKTKSYCCFNSKLGRIIQEQGRSMLTAFNSKGWGKAESPYCRGFTSEEFQMLDFNKINLDEWIGDINPAGQQQVKDAVQDGVNGYYNSIQ